MKIKKLVREYIEKWKTQGYHEDIPDEVPLVLMQERLAPSYKAIALAILRNDHNLTTLGFSAPKSDWYSAIKRIEIANRK